MLIPKVRKTPTVYNGHWVFETQMGEKNLAGFVYIVRDKYLKMFYIGKKFYFTKHKEETNWKRYLTSSNALREQIEYRDRNDFEFITLEEYKTKSALAYAEAWSLYHIHALMRDDFYNGQIDKVSWKIKEKPTKRHIDRLERAIEWDSF